MSTHIYNLVRYRGPRGAWPADGLAAFVLEFLSTLRATVALLDLSFLPAITHAICAALGVHVPRAPSAAAAGRIYILSVIYVEAPCIVVWTLPARFSLLLHAVLAGTSPPLSLVLVVEPPALSGFCQVPFAGSCLRF